MKIYSMTATFGKLSHETLTFQPGLNVISAPNEWGKSTWCAFLVAMLYGIDTRERTTQTTLADKERYAPWSGEAMSGRIDLCWNGRDITIERRTKGRSIFGEFSAYETASGLPVAELTSANCGQMLLGVEKTVFTRSAFIRQADMPVTQDEALRRRLNALVTTGDESGASDDLAQKLKDLKNKCRHNKTGLIPQAEVQQKQLQEKLAALSAAGVQISQAKQQQEALEEEQQLLENHKSHLIYQQEKQKLERVSAAKQAHGQALTHVRELEMQSADLPAKEFAEKKLQQAQMLQSSWAQLQSKTLPQIPEAPAAFTGCDDQQALQQATQDKEAYDRLRKPYSPVCLILAALCILGGIVLGLLVDWLLAIPFPVLAAVLAIVYFRGKATQRKKLTAICEKYPGLTADQWIPAAKAYAQAVATYLHSTGDYNAAKTELQEQTQALTGGKSLDAVMEEHRQTLSKWQELADARLAADRAYEYAQALSAMVRDIPQPTGTDPLTLTGEQTQQRLIQVGGELQALHGRIGQIRGQMEALGSEEMIAHQLEAVNRRIDQLENIYTAVTLAQETLTDAANELQRRFAPRIAQQAQTLFGKLTGNRYNRLQLTADLSIHASAEGEDTLRGTLWRSEGTVDQLYLALRLAVSEELTPEAPLVLDDAFVRFDDTRLSAAMDILKELAHKKQVILFTCHDRESSHT